MLGILIHIIEFITFVFSIVYYKSLNRDGLGHLCLFLGLVFFLDMSGLFLNNLNFEYIGAFYASLILFQQLYFLRLLATWNQLKINFYLGASVVIFWFLELLSELETSSFPDKAIGIGAFVLFFNGLYFMYILVVKKQTFNFFQRTDFWLVLGITIYNSLEFPYMIFLNTIKTEYPESLLLFGWFTTIFSFLMYISFCKAITCSRRI
ncbi:MAG: hypothetical protein ACKVQB_05970 [Bacteroidia bacterium]